MEWVQLIIELVFGLVAGLIAGWLGIGGGILFTPLFFFLYGQKGLADPVAWAIGSSLLCTFSASLSSTVQQVRSRNLYLREGIALGLFGMAGVWVGKQITFSEFYSEGVFVTFFALLLALVSLSFFLRPEGSGVKDDAVIDDADIDAAVSDGQAAEGGSVNGQATASRQAHVPLKQILRTFSLTGLIGGFLAALAGIGGGVAMVPMMNLGFGIRLPKAVSISSLSIVLISLSGWVQFAIAGDSSVVQGLVDAGVVSSWTIGYIDLQSVLPVALAAWTGGMFGVKLGRRVSESSTAVGFAVLTSIIAISMVLRIL